MDKRNFMRQSNALRQNFNRRTGKEKKKFGFYKCVYTYAIGGFAGTLWETCLNLARGKGFVYCNGSIFTPINLVYGIGAVVIICGLKNRKSVPEVFLIGMIGGGVVEYILSFLEETILGARSWDYSDMPLNINGRTNIPYMIVWGILCVTLVFLVYKPLDYALDGLSPKAAKVSSSVIAAIIIADLVVTVCVLARYACRNADIEALTFIGRFIDSVFDDAYMKLHFPSLNFT
ncbi:MAG: putative ABC transporter permease [Clostridia bacterium]|nr:putative ABC transporter permease [Clostridia bacterium]